MNRTFRNTIAVLAALATLGFGISFATGSKPENTPNVQVTPPSEDAQVQKIREQLRQDGLSDEGRQSLEEKLQIAERSAAQQAEGSAAKRSVKNPPLPAAASMEQPEDEFIEGIFEGSQGLVRPSQADIINVWQGQHNGEFHQVFAGSSVEPPGRGLLIVVTLDDDRPTGQRQLYLAPEGAAVLRIIEVDAGRLLLETDSGARLSFDLSTREFVE